MTGILRSSIPGFDRQSPREWLRTVAAMGLDGLMLNTPLDVSPSLDLAALDDFRRDAHDRGIRLATGLGWFNPARPARVEAAFPLGRGDLIGGFGRLIEAAARLGLSEGFYVVGMLEDRDARDVPWPRQLDGVAAGLDRLAPTLERLGFRLLVKTHEEIASAEIVRMIDRAGPRRLGVALDPVNLLVRMEDPVAAARRLGPHVCQLHLDDAQVRLEGEAVRRYLCPLGTGVIDWPSIRLLCPFAGEWIELHRGQFAVPAFDPDWLGAQPTLELEDYAAVLRMALRVPAGPAPEQADPFARLPMVIDTLRTGTGTTRRDRPGPEHLDYVGPSVLRRQEHRPGHG